MPTFVTSCLYSYSPWVYIWVLFAFTLTNCFEWCCNSGSKSDMKAQHLLFRISLHHNEAHQRQTNNQLANLYWLWKIPLSIPNEMGYRSKLAPYLHPISGVHLSKPHFVVGDIRARRGLPVQGDRRWWYILDCKLLWGLWENLWKRKLNAR